MTSQLHKSESMSSVIDAQNTMTEFDFKFRHHSEYVKELIRKRGQELNYTQE